MSTKAKNRKPNLTIREKEALVNGILKRKERVQGDSSAPDFGTQMETAWDEIAKEVNSVNASGMERSKDKLRKKYRNWKSDVKKKLAQVNRGPNLTGGGEIDYGNLDPMEQKLGHLITKEGSRSRWRTGSRYQIATKRFSSMQ